MTLNNPRLNIAGYLFYAHSMAGFMGLRWVTFLVLLFAACGSPPKEIQKKLQEIGRLDLDVILGDLPEKARREAMLPKPYFVVDEYQEFQGDTARVFQAYASLVFFYLDPSLDLCQVRKYRYRRSARLWERFDVMLRHIPQKYVSGAVAGDSSLSSKAENR
jgi:hypothetical protein